MTKIIRMGDVTGFDDAEIIELEESEEENSERGNQNDYKQN